MSTYRFQVQIDYPGTGGPGLNTWHARTVNDGAVSTQQIADALHTFYTDAAGCFSQGVTVSLQREIIKDPYGSPQYAAVDPWTVAGTAGGGMLPPATQVVVGWKTLSATRSGHGRTFLGPGGRDSCAADGTPVDGFLSVWRAAAETLVSSSLSDNGWALGVYSRKDHVLRDFSSSKVKDRFAVLCSRRD